MKLPRKICKTASEIPCPHQWATHFQTEVLAPSHLGALLSLTGARRKVHHFASRRGSLSPPLCTHLKRSLPLIKSRAKETRFGDVAPVDVQLFRITLSPFSGLSSGHPALVALVLSDQTSARVSKHLLALLYYSGSSRCLCACFACLCAPVAFLVHSFVLYHWTHVGQQFFLSIPPLAAMLQPIEFSIPMEIKFFRSLGTCRTSVNVTDLSSAMRNGTILLPTTLFVVLFAIRTSPSHAAKVSLSESVITDADADAVSEDCIFNGADRRRSRIGSWIGTEAARMCCSTHAARRVRLRLAWRVGHVPRLAATRLARAGACGRVLKRAASGCHSPGAWGRVAREIQSSSSSGARRVRGSDAPNFKRRVRAHLNSDLESV
ncbi:hypothetical protein Acr_25g0004590 [Actinidia rufa]|uniref:Uncharacterized protein n=1 Tax=Actinidia rufa TaxID=165716 RepID=A0A7J0GYY4_9ERIC|nr:hypothetical protein Acr_25g0004590 [Actinidia rufa]